MHISGETLDIACAHVLQRWRQYLPDHEARAQAQAFRRRCETVAAARRPSEAELDDTLAIVGALMAEP